ncbi:MAG: bifunctional folylpolyglutamate synthase/dihydrofolate synthase [Deltaproteobacteria bacterium]|nr:bifunctional folylpolyglutamate synthase/dihydrofolate synthase [Deltaproteobacteria bacterium]
MTAHEALRAIEALDKFGINLGLERISRCLDLLGRPQDACPTVHVGGTNGKGSTCLLTAATLSESGLRTGLYTSPPLEAFGERIRIDGECLPDEAVPGLLEEVLAVRGGAPELSGMTQFEVITAMAFLHFAREKVDAAVIEVGLGGRLDSTNVIVPWAAAVTNVGVEHAEHLGSTVADIAREKAGIAKPGIPLVTAAEGEALDALEAEARRRGAPVLAVGRDLSVTRDAAGAWSFRGRRWRLDGLRLGLLGSHQGLNLAVAAGLLEELEGRGIAIPEAALRRAFEAARWPGRLELVPGVPAVLLDGAHNPHASRVLAAALAHDVPHERLLLVLGVLGDKDARSILADLLPLAQVALFTRSGSGRALDPGALEALGREVGASSTRVHPSIPAALDAALAEALPGDLVCVTGSLTTVGEARSHLRRLGRLP